MPGDFLETLRTVEAKWQKKWEEAKIFEADPDPSKEKFFLTVPYPYTSGALHIGHGRTYTIGDIIARFKRMQGYNVLWPMAFHITGTPIEGISARIRSGEESAIREFRDYVKLYVDDEEKVREIIESFKEPWNVAKFFSSVIIRDFKSLGFGIDWRRQFTTGDPEYNAFVTWQFKKLNEKGYIKQGKYPILFCVAHGNAVGEDDIKGGDEIKPDIIEFTVIKFKMNGVYLAAATLRPETIFGVTNVWVHPEGTYVEAKVDGEKWIISKEAAFKLSKQERKVEVLKEIKGRDLVGKTCISPINREIPILPGRFVDTDNATGVVYSVPAHAPFDWIALKDLQENPEMIKEFGLDVEEVRKIKPISIIKIDGYGEYPAIEVCERMKIKNQDDVENLEKATDEIYKAEYYRGIMKENCGQFAGRKVSEVKDDVVSFLKEQGMADIMYEVTALEKPVICRCGGKVIAVVLPDQWFIDYSKEEWKQKARKCLEKMVIYPKTYRKLFEDTIEWLRERPCARKRGIGTRLPFDPEWIIESLSDSTIYMAFYTVIHHIRNNKIDPSKLSYEFWDYVFLGNGTPEDVSKKTGIPTDLLKKMHEEFEYWYPVDQRHTAPAHITNHLTFFIFHHVAIFPEDKWPKKITLNELVIKEGRKMSKSYGNVIPLVDIARKYSSDLYRLYVAYAADLPTTMDWREKEVAVTMRRLQQFWNLVNEILEMPEEKLELENISSISRWLLSKINTTIRDVTQFYEELRFRDAIIQSFFELMHHIDFYRKIMKDGDKKEEAAVLRYVLDKWLRLLAPVIPHICEEIWHKLGNEGFISTESWPVADEKLIDEKIETSVDVVLQTISDIKEILSLIRDQKPSTAYIYIAPEWKYQVFRKIAESNVPLTVKSLMPLLMKDEKLRKFAKGVQQIVQRIVKAGKLWKFADPQVEFDVFQKFAEYIARETGLEKAIIERAEEAKHSKAEQALPGRPAILLT